MNLPKSPPRGAIPAVGASPALRPDPRPAPAAPNVTPPTALNPLQFDWLKRTLQTRAGILLDEKQAYLFEPRLGPLALKAGLKTAAELINKMGVTPHEPTIQLIVEAMTTNETSFFRDGHPFEILKSTVFPELILKKPKRAPRIWCAASSTGQEPYSIAMMLVEHFPQLVSAGLQIIATDINDQVLAKARTGEFSELEIARGLTSAQKSRFFTPKGKSFVLQENVRRIVQFKNFNLAGVWPAGIPYDIVFARNVLIYFDADTRQRILRNIHRSLDEGGILFLGTVESPPDKSLGYETVRKDRTIFFRKIVGKVTQP